MIAAASRRACVTARVLRPPVANFAPLRNTWRGLSSGQSLEDDADAGGIPENIDTGEERKERVSVHFQREPVYPEKGAGTKEHPIKVPSMHNERVVGFEDPSSHAMYWFNMEAGKLHYVKHIDMYFKLQPVEYE